MSGLRALIGFLIAPGALALILYLVGLFFVADWEAAFWPRILAIFGYLSAILIGIPVHVYLHRKGINSLTAYLVMGALIGLTCYILFFGIEALLSWQSYPEHALMLLKNSVRSGVIAIVYAAVASVVFWLIAVRQA